MTFLQSILLGIVQGITEFLPISSTAHLVLLPYLLNWKIPEEQLFPFDVLVQMGTLAALIYYNREDLGIILKAMLKGIIRRKPFAQLEARVGWLTLLATIPAGVIGIAFKKAIAATFLKPAITAIFLFITAPF
jgi:undecaprenyl-diphosphatase